tara:strand:+ start:217 stop:1158 length:942 start_codon:yes stop_codon:yes gene_type:complete
MISEPLVTIGITSFNSQKTILRAIEGAVKQNWSKKEIIIIDDCSNDNSVELIKESQLFKYIKLFRNKNNIGAAGSRNKIINKSKGEIICFMDDDDLSMPNRVKKQIEAMKNVGFPNQKLIACSVSMERTYNNGYKRRLISMGSNGLAPNREELAEYILFFEKKDKVDYGFGLPTCSLAITKECFKKVGLFDENLKRVEDLDMAIRLSFNEVIFTGVPEILIKQTISERQNKNAEINYHSEVKVIKKNKAFLKKKKLFWHSMQWPKIRYFYFKRNFFKLLYSLLILILLNPRRSLTHLFETARKRLILDLKINS